MPVFTHAYTHSIFNIMPIARNIHSRAPKSVRVKIRIVDVANSPSGKPYAQTLSVALTGLVNILWVYAWVNTGMFIHEKVKIEVEEREAVPKQKILP